MDNFIVNLDHSRNRSKKGITEKAVRWEFCLRQFCEVSFVINYEQNSIENISPSCLNLLGYPAAFFNSGGLPFFFGLWCKRDLAVYERQIFPEIVKFFTGHRSEDACRFLFTFNFKCYTSERIYTNVLLKTVFTLDEQQNKPARAYCLMSDADGLRNDQEIIFIIQQLDNNHRLVHPQILRKVFYRDNEIDHLSNREKEIFGAIVEGLKTKEIAKKFSLSIFTINNHRKSILEKIKCRNVVELIKKALH